ncbi:MAG: RecT family recombinase [Candidatus Paceibacterota bacterium]|jgi:hypothetical protein
MKETTTESSALALASQGNEIARLDAASMILGPAWDRIQAFGKMMARGGITVPRHFHGNEADCAAVTMQALTWGMNPFAVAQKTHVTQGGALGYEAQLVNAVIQNSGELEGDPEYEHFGDWSKVLGKVEERKSDKGGKYYVATYTKADEQGLGVIVRATLRGEKKPRELELLMSQAYPRFSTQWATDPKQQICYLALRKFVRLNKPGVLLGVYTEDELPTASEKFMGPAEVVPPPEKPVWTAEDWQASMPMVLKGIARGKTIDDALAWLRAKADVTPEQEKQLRDEVAKLQQPKQPTQQQVKTNGDAPQVDQQKLETDMQAADNLDKLYELGGLIEAVTDEAARLRLTEIFDARIAELENAE